MSDSAAVDLAEYARRIDAAGLSGYRDALVEAALPSIRLEVDAETSTDDVGTTRLGGLPDLPSATEWPSDDGEPLSFIAQVDLAAVHDLDTEGLLPDSGMLSFFYAAEAQSAWGFDPADHGAFAVLYSPAHVALVRREAPPSLVADAVFEPVALSPRSEVTFVPGESFAAEAIGLSRPERLRYADLLDDRADDAIVHRLLGHADLVQGDMQVEAQLVTHGLYCGDPSGYRGARAQQLRPGSGEWRLLLQIDSEDAAGMMWGDVGRLFYWIRREDLLARQFELSWLILQCS